MGDAGLSVLSRTLELCATLCLHSWVCKTRCLETHTDGWICQKAFLTGKNFRHNSTQACLCDRLQDRGAFHNEVHPRHVLLQPLLQGGRRKYMLIDYGGAACPRLTDPAIEAQLCLPNQDVAPMLEVRPSIQDLLCGSLQSLLGSWGRLLSQGSDLQSLVFTVVLLAGGHLRWEDAAEAGTPEETALAELASVCLCACMQALPASARDCDYQEKFCIQLLSLLEHT